MPSVLEMSKMLDILFCGPIVICSELLRTGGLPKHWELVNTLIFSQCALSRILEAVDGGDNWFASELSNRLQSRLLVF